MGSPALNIIIFLLCFEHDRLTVRLSRPPKPEFCCGVMGARNDLIS